MRKQESSKYTGFYSLNLQWYIPWPLQGDPPGAKKKLAHGSWSPQGPTRRDDTPPREPSGTLKARKPTFFLMGKAPLEPSFEKTSFLKIIKKHKEYKYFCIEHSPLDR